jgi:excinuclease ABC subunit B
MTDRTLQLVADFAPAGDQPQAIEQLGGGLQNGLAKQTLLGVTGSGKTFSMASVSNTVQRPTLSLARDKTRAAQLDGEWRACVAQEGVEGGGA